MKTRLLRLNTFMCIQSFIVTFVCVSNLVYIPTKLFCFSQFLAVFEIHCRTKAVVCQNILMVTVLCTSAGHTQ